MYVVCGLCSDNFCGMIVCSKLTCCVICLASYPSGRLRGLQPIQECKVMTACSLPENGNVAYWISCTFPTPRSCCTHAFRHVESINNRALYLQLGGRFFLLEAISCIVPEVWRSCWKIERFHTGKTNICICGLWKVEN